MKKLMVLMLVLMLAAFMAACGTETEEGTSADQPVEENNEETVVTEDDTTEEEAETEENAGEEQPAEDASEETEESEAPAEEDPAEEAESDIRLLEQPMTLPLNGEETERTAFLQESEENNYSIYVAEGFTFTPEEPNVDQVFLNEDGSQFMRIHTYPKEDVEAGVVEGQMKDQADAIQGEDSAEWTPENIENEVIAGYEAVVGEEQYKTYLFEKNDIYVRIAIHTSVDSDLEDAFIQMAETIE
ncbi:hypothetical protein [Jeotgalibacillus sp. JSM ZJ347]|uniref:hypothetical protein n=1 Tax=Jeotgalibacillus sp. JSM ZJ347 TaxID=3342117 RepID=UPI0035A8F5CF